MSTRTGPSVSHVLIDDAGIHAVSATEAVLDLQFDGRRVWSFWLLRDGVTSGGTTLVAWPKPLRKYLDGHSRLSLVVHATGEVVYDAEHAFGTSAERIAVVDAEGNPLATDKTGHLVKTFANRSPEHVAPLLDALDEVLAALRAAGIEAFLAYGTALGAVREGKLIGHDSDADLGYVSHHDHPVDVMRESFRLQARLAEMGYPTIRYSGGAFMVRVKEADGSYRGLDVFGGFLRDGYLHLMGEIRVPFREDWIFPLTTATLEGRAYPVPANPDRFLAATYGESWRHPDPAFKFETPASTVRRLSGWFRGIRVNRGMWDGIYSKVTAPTDLTPSDFARWVRDREPDAHELVDLGCGRGIDAYWFATQGLQVTGLDHSPRGFAALAERAGREALDLRYLPFNLLELRSLLAVSALVATRPGPRVLTARHLVDALDARGRRSLWRACDMMTRDGGSLYLEFVSKKGEDRYAGRHHVMARRTQIVVEELEAAGARILFRETFPAPQQAPSAAASDHSSAEGAVPSKISRLVATWQH